MSSYTTIENGYHLIPAMTIIIIVIITYMIKVDTEPLTIAHP